MKIPVFVFVVIIATGCFQPNTGIQFDKSKPGGLYETSEAGSEFKFYNRDESYKLDKTTFIPLSDFKRIQRQKSDSDFDDLAFVLTEAGKEKFRAMTARNIGKPICFVIENKVVTAPTVNAEIPNGRGSITTSRKNDIEQIIEYLTK